MSRAFVVDCLNSVNDFVGRTLGVRLARDDSRIGTTESHLIAAKALEQIESTKGALSPALRRRATEYAAEVLGDVRYSPWLFVYSAFNGVFREGWIPVDFFEERVTPQINKPFKVLTEAKTLSRTLLRSTHFPDLAYYIDGILYDLTYRRQSLEGFIAEMQDRYEEVFLKSDYSGFGVGLARVATAKLSIEKLAAMGDCVVQWPIRQHPFFEQFVKGPVATLSITTVKELDGSFSKRAAALRVGREAGDFVQNSSQLRIVVRGEGGELDGLGYNSQWAPSDRHPDTGFVFADLKVPEFGKAVQVCLDSHAQAPHFGVVVWDVAIDATGQVVIIEWNGNYPNIRYSEAILGPCFSDLGWELRAR